MSPINGAKIKILCIDDNLVNLAILTVPLKEKGLDAIGETDPVEALQLIETGYFDLILLDIMMPGISGIDVIKVVRNKYNQLELPIIMVTTIGSKKEIANALKLGANDYITKPVDFQITWERIQTHLKMKSFHEMFKNQEMKRVEDEKMSTLVEMTGSIAHEILNPMTVVLGFLEILKLQDDNSKRDEIFEKIISNINKVSLVISGMKIFAGISNSKVQKKLKLKEIIESAKLITGFKLEGANILLEINIEDENLIVEGSKGLLTQVLYHLIKNSINALEEIEKKWIKISLRSNNNNAEILVSDSGKGISKSIQHRIYHPFFTTHSVNDGYGLGLSVAKQILSEHKGSISLNTDSPDTEFIISIPLAKL